MLALHPFFGRPLLLLPETSNPSDFAQTRLRSRLKQWQTHSVFYFPGKCQHILRAPPS